MVFANAAVLVGNGDHPRHEVRSYRPVVTASLRDGTADCHLAY
jgi:hypothetical protein